MIHSYGSSNNSLEDRGPTSCSLAKGHIRFGEMQGPHPDWRRTIRRADKQAEMSLRTSLVRLPLASLRNLSRCVWTAIRIHVSYPGRLYCPAWSPLWHSQMLLIFRRSVPATFSGSRVWQRSKQLLSVSGINIVIAHARIVCLSVLVYCAFSYHVIGARQLQITVAICVRNCCFGFFRTRHSRSFPFSVT
jgi:hypothetical protein